MSRYLIIRLAALGDVAMASALARRIRDADPAARIDWMAGGAGAALARCFPEVDRVIEIDDVALLRGSPAGRGRAIARVWAHLLASRYDRVLLAHPDPRYRVLTLPVAAAKVTAMSRTLGAMNPVPGRYMGDEFARLLDGNAHVGPLIGPADGHWPLSDVRASPAPGQASVAAITAHAARDGATRPQVVLVPGGGRNVLRESALKRWPVASYAALAERLVARGARVTLVGDANDAWARPAFAGIPVDDTIGALAVPELLATIAGAALVVSHDTGPMHLARLTRTPLVALFGPTRPMDFVAADERVTVLWGGAHLACRPCYDGREFAACRDNACIRSVTVGQVLEAAEGFLAAHPLEVPA